MTERKTRSQRNMRGPKQESRAWRGEKSWKEERGRRVQEAWKIKNVDFDGVGGRRRGRLLLGVDTEGSVTSIGGARNIHRPAATSPIQDAWMECKEVGRRIGNVCICG